MQMPQLEQEEAWGTGGDASDTITKSDLRHQISVRRLKAKTLDSLVRGQCGL